MKLAKIKYTFLLLLSFSIFSGQIPRKPEKIYPVVDEANLLSSHEEQLLNTKLIDYFKNTSTEILIVTIHNLQGADENIVAAQIGEDWKIGEEEKDNGIVILVSKNDRKVAIQSGYGTNIHLTATKTKQIISNEIIPYFKKNNFYRGLDKGTEAIFQVLEGKYNAPSSQREEDTVSLFILLIIIIIILIYKFRNKNGGGKGRKRYKRSINPFDIVLTGSGRSSWRSSGSSRGFGGGGSFGGGGASGSW